MALLVFIVAMVPHFNAANLFDIAAMPNTAGEFIFALVTWAFGLLSLFAIWFFLAVEGAFGC